MSANPHRREQHSMTRTIIENKSCRLISSEENDILFGLIGPRCLILSSGVVQLFLTEHPQHSHWIKKLCGVACFIKDNNRMSFFIRIYDVEHRVQLWEQELYTQLKYKSPHPLYHMFEIEDCMALLNFADEGEANAFLSVALEKLKKRTNVAAKRSHTLRPPDRPNNNNGSSNISHAASMDHLASNTLKRDKKNKKFSKEDIGRPTNFVHVQHIGWNPEKGFNTENVTSEMLQFFDKAGVSDKLLRNRKAANFIYSIIDANGGIEAAMQEGKMHAQKASFTGNGSHDSGRPLRSADNHHQGQGAAPPVPARQTPPTFQPQIHPPAPPAAPPGIPMRTVAPSIRPSGHHAQPPPPPVRQASTKMQAPRAPQVNVPHPPPPPSSGFGGRPPPPPSTSGGGPPPPPPPPPPPAPMAPAAPPPPPPPSSMPVAQSGVSEARAGGDGGDMRSALLASIRSGAALKPVEKAEKAPAADERSQLLDEIRQGTQLKRVVKQELPPVAEPQLDGIAGALARALAERAKFITDSDESSEDEDDEWSD